MGMVGGYTLDLYCDFCPSRRKAYSADSFAQYVAETYAECVRLARADGWVVNRRGKRKHNGAGLGRCVCPKHRRNKGKT
jgi:hypothetical protein